MQIFAIINLPWKPYNNKIVRSESNHKKKHPNNDYKTKKHCKEKQVTHILLAKQPNRDCMRKKHMLQNLSNTVVYFSVFGWRKQQSEELTY